MGKTGKTSWVKVAAVNAVVVLILILGLEFYLRRNLNRLAVFEGTTGASYFRYHELLGWEPIPGSYDREYGTVTISPEGFRTCPGEAGQAGGNIILAGGDSFTFGSFVSDEETWPCYLSSFTGRRVVNAGVPGYGLDQIVLRLTQSIDEVEPALVIISIIPDSIIRSIMSRRDRLKPYFEIVDDRLVLRHNPVPRPFSDRTATNWYDRSVLLRLLADKFSPDIEYVNSDPEEVSLLLFRKAFNITRRRGIPLVVVLQPESPQLPRKKWATGSVLKGYLRALGVAVLDLHSPFEKNFPTEQERVDLFSAREHLIGEGNRWVAEQIAGFLRKRRLFDQIPSKRPDSSIPPAGKKESEPANPAGGATGSGA